MTARDVLDNIAARGVRVWITSAGKVKTDPPDALTESDKAFIRQHFAEIREALVTPVQTTAWSLLDTYADVFDGAPPAGPVRLNRWMVAREPALHIANIRARLEQAANAELSGSAWLVALHDDARYLAAYRAAIDEQRGEEPQRGDLYGETAAVA